MERQLPNPRKSYNAPFWVMFFVALILTAGYIIGYWAAQKVNTSFHRKQINYNIWFMLWPALLWAETIMYRLVRKKIKKILYVWLHISSVIAAFILMPVCVALVTVFATTHNNLMVARQLRQVWQVIFWATFIIGHAFFITTIVKSFTKRKEIIEDNEATPGILDGIIEEF